MNNFRFPIALLILLTPLAFIGGCGGGGGGGGQVSPTAVPSPAPTATVGSRVLVVQLRDSARQPVEGIVTVGTAVISTVNGEATFNRNVVAGITVVSAEVDGVVTTGTATVAASGSTIYTLTIAPSVTPVPTTTVPPPPFPT